jgi:hypothetical protein
MVLMCRSRLWSGNASESFEQSTQEAGLLSKIVPGDEFWIFANGPVRRTVSRPNGTPALHCREKSVACKISSGGRIGRFFSSLCVMLDGFMPVRQTVNLCFHAEVLKSLRSSIRGKRPRKW